MFLGTVSRTCRFALGIGTIAFSPIVAGHGFGERYDLPVPLWLWVTGAGATIVLSFVIVGVFSRNHGATTAYSRVNLLEVSLLRSFAHRVPLAIVRAVAVILLIATVLAGFVGDPDPLRNLAPVMVWVVCWVGVAFVCALIGDLWALVNPFRTLFCWAEWIFERLTA
ncbi:MAG TPA: hypothetical protein EYO72_05600, partial [Marine Group III euryarchaeote]|nr:hypothetical protein [Marine Group III euryarchaeote]